MRDRCLATIAGSLFLFQLIVGYARVHRARDDHRYVIEIPCREDDVWYEIDGKDEVGDGESQDDN